MTDPLKDLSFHALFDAAADAMLLIDDTSHVIEANPVALRLLDYTAEEITGLEVEALMPPQYRSHYHLYRDAFYSKPKKHSMDNARVLIALRRNGKKLPVDISLSPIKTQAHLYILVTFNLADRRRQTEEALIISEERLRLAKQAAGLGVFDFDPKLNFIHWDERMRELWGGESEKSVAYNKFVAAIHPDDRKSRQAAVDHAIDPAGNGEYHSEYRIINPIDGIERWIVSVGQTHFEDGRAIRLVGVVRDVTEHKVFEKKLQEQRAETETLFKQQVAAQTVSAIAHELNQPLAAVSAYSEVALHALQTDTVDSVNLKKALEGCVKQAHRAGQSLHELLAFLQKGELITERFNLNDIVKEALDIARNDGYGGFHLRLHLEQNMHAVLGNRIQVQKVLVNLLRNAVEAMRGAGTPTSAITITVRTNTRLVMAHVTVRDSGPGLNPETAKRVFEPFFTTKASGIGMGLAISRALIEANGGQLWLEPSTKPRATFHFTLPFAS